MKYFSMCDKKFKVYYDAKGYALIWLNGKNQKIHVLLWEIYYGGKPKGHDIHHKDFNKANYDINNLELLTKSDHQKIHKGWFQVGDKWVAKPCSFCKKTLPIDAFYVRRTANTPSAKCKSCNWAYLKKLKGGNKFDGFDKKCKLCDDVAKYRTKKLCKKHYQQWRRKNS